MRKLNLSCHRCYIRATSTVALTAVFVCSSLLHFLDPSYVQTLGLPREAAYGIAAFELFFAGSLWTTALAEVGFWGLALTMLGAAGMYVRQGEFGMLTLPAVPLAFLAALWWSNRPGMACACHIKHYPAVATPDSASE